MPCLVDTDILIDLLRQREGAAEYLDSLANWSLSVVSGMELVAGAKSKREFAQIDNILSLYSALPLSAEIGELGYNLMKSYAKSHGLDPDDALIAATAIHEGRKLATKNGKHFEGIGALEVAAPEY